MELEQYFPRAMKAEIRGKNTKNLEEVRIRIGQPVEWIYNNGTCMGTKRIGREDMEEILNYLTDYSWYAMEEQFRQGFFTLEGGFLVINIPEAWKELKFSTDEEGRLVLSID